jgi:hypothetical protein
MSQDSTAPATPITGAASTGSANGITPDTPAGASGNSDGIDVTDWLDAIAFGKEVGFGGPYIKDMIRDGRIKAVQVLNKTNRPTYKIPPSELERFRAERKAELERMGPLRFTIELGRDISGLSIQDLSVLSERSDPYRQDTDAGHRDGKWFGDMVRRFVPSGTVHLRGLHYRLVADSDVSMPNGQTYINTDDCWGWLQEVSIPARWLNYVDFERIRDERNDPPEIFVPETSCTGIWLSEGEHVTIPPFNHRICPEFQCNIGCQQPYRIAFIGEKSSLRDVLLPIASRVGGELLLPTGECSTSMVAGLARRADADGRPLVILYFSDFDPSGWHMPVNVARRLQAMRDLKYPGLEIQVHAVCLNHSQVTRLTLPSTPLKEKERRADKWRAAWGHEQTEIDALCALQPEVLREIAEEAVAPFHDHTLGLRISEAEDEWQENANTWLQDQDAYGEGCVRLEPAYARVRQVYEQVRVVAEEYNSIQREVSAELDSFNPGDCDIPEAELDDAPAPLFSTDDNFVHATRRLIKHRDLVEPN